jgi:hypothetical protein
MFSVVRSAVRTRSLFIQAEQTPNLHSIKFKPGKQVLTTTKTYEFTTQRESIQSPLAMSLFKVDGVASVLFGQDFITVIQIN